MGSVFGTDETPTHTFLAMGLADLPAVQAWLNALVGESESGYAAGGFQVTRTVHHVLQFQVFPQTSGTYDVLALCAVTEG